MKKASNYKNQPTDRILKILYIAQRKICHSLLSSTSCILEIEVSHHVYTLQASSILTFVNLLMFVAVVIIDTCLSMVAFTIDTRIFNASGNLSAHSHFYVGFISKFTEKVDSSVGLS